MLTLIPVNLHWITQRDDPRDLCAHGSVRFRIGATDIVSPENGDWTVSAAALYLLRSLKNGHTKTSPVGEHFFPCCGQPMPPAAGDDVALIECAYGIDCEIILEHDRIVIRGENGSSYPVARPEWVAAVCSFSDAVRMFYERSSPKQPTEEIERQAYDAFLREWARRRSKAHLLL